MVEQGLSHGFMATEQELPRQESKVEHELLPSRAMGIMDDDIQCLEGGVMNHQLVAVRQL